METKEETLEVYAHEVASSVGGEVMIHAFFNDPLDEEAVAAFEQNVFAQTSDAKDQDEQS